MISPTRTAVAFATGATSTGAGLRGPGADDDGVARRRTRRVADDDDGDGGYAGAARRARRRRQQRQQRPRRYASASSSASRAREMVSSTSCSVWAVDMNPASNADGAKKTPRRSSAW